MKNQQNEENFEKTSFEASIIDSRQLEHLLNNDAEEEIKKPIIKPVLGKVALELPKAQVVPLSKIRTENQVKINPPPVFKIKQKTLKPPANTSLKPIKIEKIVENQVKINPPPVFKIKQKTLKPPTNTSLKPIKIEKVVENLARINPLPVFKIKQKILEPSIKTSLEPIKIDSVSDKDLDKKFLNDIQDNVFENINEKQINKAPVEGLVKIDPSVIETVIEQKILENPEKVILEPIKIESVPLTKVIDNEDIKFEQSTPEVVINMAQFEKTDPSSSNSKEENRKKFNLLLKSIKIRAENRSNDNEGKKRATLNISGNSVIQNIIGNQSQLSSQKKLKLKWKIPSLSHSQHRIYQPQVDRIIRKYWNLPPGLEPSLENIVECIIAKDGEIVSIKFLETSGNPVFDQFVKQIFHNLTRFPPLPKPFPGEFTEIALRFTSTGTNVKSKN